MASIPSLLVAMVQAGSCGSDLTWEVPYVTGTDLKRKKKKKKEAAKLISSNSSVKPT